MSLIVDEAILGRCGSCMILTATVSEIFGVQTNSSSLVVRMLITYLWTFCDPLCVTTSGYSE